MKSEEERRWERMQQVLAAEARGDAPVTFSSGRTLFGIKSHVEEVIERVAAEDEERCKAGVLTSQANVTSDAFDSAAKELEMSQNPSRDTFSQN